MDGWRLPAERAVALSGLSFLHGQGPALADHVNESLAQGVDEGTIRVSGVDARWYWHQLDWDSAYFGVPVIRLDSAAWDSGLADPIEELARVAAGFRAETNAAHGSYYMFAELPATDSEPLQALGLSGFRLVETRLTYFVPDTSAFCWPEHYPVRTAELSDMPHLRDVAASARNRYDRYHADPFFGDAIADRYLATYAEESVKGLADLIVVPDPGDGAPPGGFFTVKIEEPSSCPFGRDHVCPIDMGVGRIPLVAVTPARSGWHLRLLVETTRILATRSVRVASMTTQATNRAVVRNCEKVGYRLGSVTHILAASHGEAR